MLAARRHHLPGQEHQGKQEAQQLSRAPVRTGYSRLQASLSPSCPNIFRALCSHIPVLPSRPRYSVLTYKEATPAQLKKLPRPIDQCTIMPLFFFLCPFKIGM